MRHKYSMILILFIMLKNIDFVNFQIWKDYLIFS